MNWTATARYGARPAPGGLALVHDFLSTMPGGRPRQADLLSDLGSAQAWLDEAWSSADEAAGAEDADRPLLAEGDLPHLRRLRESIHQSLIERSTGAAGSSSSPPISTSLSAELLPDGTVRMVFRATGRKRLMSRLLVEIYEAQLADVWRRLKPCKNEKCRGIFFDRSRNNSGVWHDVRTCGNAANLRASRARRKHADALS